MVIKITNTSLTTKVYCGYELKPDASMIIPERMRQESADCPFLFVDILNNDVQIEADGILVSGMSAINVIKGLTNVVVTPTATKNEHELNPEGLCKKTIVSSNYYSAITLTHVEDLNYSYSSDLIPSVGDCIMSDDDLIFITEINDNILTLSKLVSNLNSMLSKKVDVSYTLPTTDYGIWYLWGVQFSAKEFGEDDFCRFFICDPMGNEIKAYDSCWVEHLNSETVFKTPDGAPGEIPDGFILKVCYHPTTSTSTIKIKIDYILSLKKE